MEPSILARPATYFEERGAIHTFREILQQPEVWNELCDYLLENRQRIAAFMKPVLATPGLRTVFTGAGSSAFIGESMQNMLLAELGILCETVHTTDIVSAPDCVLADVPTLLISYSRSGESPESEGAIRYASKRVKQLYNLVIVCKKHSSLADYAEKLGNTLVLDMPPASSDAAFAMTSSVSCMSIATWCAFSGEQLPERVAYIRLLAQKAAEEMMALDAKAREISAWHYDRLIFLASGKLRGLARESHVKSLELTAGLVHAGYDTAAGFRHGPKGAVNGTTLTVHFISADPFTAQYDLDLLREMLGEKTTNRIVAVLPKHCGEALEKLDARVEYTLPADQEGSGIGSYLQSLIFTQLLAAEKSLNCGIRTDTPSPCGTINRVVKGVVIYEL